MRNLLLFLTLPSIIGALPVTLQNGTTADATQVMSDLNWIVNQVNANAAPLANTALLNANNNFTAEQSGVNATARTSFPLSGQVQDGMFNTLSSTLGTNTITGRISGMTITGYVSGQIFKFLPTQTNTGAVTLNVDGVGARGIMLGGTNLTGGEIRQLIPLQVQYSDPVFHIVGPYSGGNLPSGVIKQTTQDGADTGQIAINGGGATGNSRGGQVTVYGNENGVPGAVRIESGDVAAAQIILTQNRAGVRTSLFNLAGSGSPYGWLVQYNNLAPNNTDSEFLYCTDNASVRAYIRSNGGFANFQANDVNLSDATVKDSMQLAVTIPDLMEKLWDAHKRVDWGLFKYKDQTHDDPNFGYTAQGVADAFKDVAPWLVGEWTDEKNPGLLAVYSEDLKNITSAIVVQLQQRIEQLEQQVKDLQAKLP